MKMFRSLLVLALSFSLLLSTLTANAGQLHAILVIDTNDFSIGDSVKSDLLHYQDFLKKVARYTDLKLVETVFSGDEFISDNVYTHIKNLNVQADDTVIFYYSGHGYRTDSKSTIWPVMHFGWQQLGLDLQDIANLIQQKQPHMALVMSDTCNGIAAIDDAPNWNRSLQARVVVDENTLRKAYRQLFLQENSMIMVTSSEPGQYSYGTASGGVYTNSFLKSLYYEVELKSPSWQKLLTRAAKKVDSVEHPKYEFVNFHTQPSTQASTQSS